MVTMGLTSSLQVTASFWTLDDDWWQIRYPPCKKGIQPGICVQPVVSHSASGLVRYGWLHADTRPYSFFTRRITNIALVAWLAMGKWNFKIMFRGISRILSVGEHHLSICIWHLSCPLSPKKVLCLWLSDRSCFDHPTVKFLLSFFGLNAGTKRNCRYTRDLFKSYSATRTMYKTILAQQWYI